MQTLSEVLKGRGHGMQGQRWGWGDLAAGEGGVVSS